MKIVRLFCPRLLVDFSCVIVLVLCVNYYTYLERYSLTYFLDSLCTYYSITLFLVELVFYLQGIAKLLRYASC